MSVSHHLDDATLLRYASGDLNDAFLTVVATHLAMCESCRDSARRVEDVGGNMLSSFNGVPLSDQAFEDLMASLDSADEKDKPAETPHKIAGDVPLPLQSFIGTSYDGIKWRTIAPGVRKCALMGKGKHSSLFLLHIQPGQKVPEHGHGGHEVTVVLKGAYSDHMGDYLAGDVADIDEHIEHQPRVTSSEPCICLIAIETPTRFKGFIEKALQPFARI